MTRKIILIFMLFFGVTNLLLNTNIYLKKNLNIDPEKKQWK